MFPNKILGAVLPSVNFNVSTGFADSYMSGGIFGMYFMYLFMFIGLTILLNYVKPSTKYKMTYIGIMCAITMYMFFSNTLNYSAISFPIVYPILSKFKINIHNNINHLNKI